MKGKYIYVTTAGEYSGYCVTGAFLDPRQVVKELGCSLRKAEKRGNLIIYRASNGQEVEIHRQRWGAYTASVFEDGKCLRHYYRNYRSKEKDIFKITKSKEGMILSVQGTFRDGKTAMRFTEEVRCELLLLGIFDKARETLKELGEGTYVYVTDVKVIKGKPSQVV